MFHRFSLDKEEYLRKHHWRPNVESAFSAAKRVFGAAVRSKTLTAMRNEVLAKRVCHKVVQTVHAMYEPGVEVSFATEEQSVAKMILNSIYERKPQMRVADCGDR
jgi:hypothetical protein